MNLEKFKVALKAADGEVEDIPNVVVLQSGDWEIQHRDYAARQDIVQHGTHFFSVTHTRSGSYYTDYYYEEPGVYEVAPRQVSRTEYVAVPVSTPSEEPKDVT